MTVALPLAIAWIGGLVLAPLDGRRPWIAWLAAAVLAVHAGVLLVLLWSGDAVTDTVAGGWPVGLGIRLRADGLGLAYALATAAVLLCAYLYEIGRGIAWARLPAMILLLAAGLDGVFLTGDAFNFYVFFEVSMVASFALAAYGPRTARFREALVFTTVNLVGSVLFLGSIGALYHLTGTLDLVELGRTMRTLSPSVTLPVAATLLAAFGLKVGLFPFHTWVPGVYVGTVPGVAAILGGAVASIGTYGLLRFGSEILVREAWLGSGVLVALSGLTIVYGAVLALGRRRPEAVLAYSSISQAGYVLLAIAIGGPAGFAAGAVFGVVNVLDKGMLFLAAGMRGWLASAAVLVGVLSLAGLPPAGGFVSKLVLLRGGVVDQAWVAVVLLVVGGALALAYGARLHRLVAWDGTPPQVETKGQLPEVAVATLLLLLVGLFAWPEPLVAWGEAVGVRLGRVPP